MATPFIGQITMFGGNFAPRSWAFCDGQLLSIPQFDALFSLLGTTYGGDGRTTFGLPDLRGRAPMHMGSGVGLTPRTIGQKSGQYETSLVANNVPAHTHAQSLVGTHAPVDQINAPGATFGRTQTGPQYGPPENMVNTAAQLLSPGGGQPHGNEQPHLAINYIIALIGIYPSRT